jgi:hypothetical protein
LCTVTSAGTFNTSISYSPVRLGFSGDGVNAYFGYPSGLPADDNWPTQVDYNDGPTVTYNLSVAPPGNNAPNAPTISGPTTGNPNTSYSFNLTATDPEGDTLRYGIDWNNDGAIDQWVPGSGYVASGTTQTASYTWTTPGTYTFQVLAQDSNGSQTGWVSHTITIAAVSGGGTCTWQYKEGFNDISDLWSPPPGVPL